MALTPKGLETVQQEGRLTDEEMPRLKLTRKRALILLLFTLVTIVFFYLFLPKIAGLQDTWEKVKNGDPTWLLLACLFELLSFLGYVLLFRAVCIHSHDGMEDSVGVHMIDWRESYQITMAGLAATRVFAAAGAGGIALTAWALRRSGLPRRTVAHRMLTFMTLLYGVFVFSVLLTGFGLWVGLLPGPSPFALTLIPASLALLAFLLALLMAAVSQPLSDGEIDSTQESQGRLGRLISRAAVLPSLFSEGLSSAWSFTKTKNLGILGAPAWWLFDIAVLWACFNAFGTAPAFSVIVMCYFLGQLASLLPLPGGIGGVEGGMIAACIAFGVSDGLAIVSVLTYRGFAFWLPTVPGAIAYFQLRRTVTGWQEQRPLELST